MKKFYLFILLSCITLAGFAQVTTTFEYTGANQTYTVPGGVYSISFDIRGAVGGGIDCIYTDYETIGGCGGRVQGVLSVSPGEVLKVIVAGEGVSTSGVGGFGGGGNDPDWTTIWPGCGGGGGTFIEDNVSAAIYAVAGGGGGGGGGWCPGSGTFTGLGDAGGNGGGLTAATGNCDACGLLTGGGGGTPIAGGGAGSCSGDAGLPGGFGVGGNYPGGLGSGGGGGGWYGGGSGGYGGGGGGGSSYTNPAYASDVIHTPGYDCGNGVAIFITIPVAAINNSPCLNDTLKLDAAGDSTGALYAWTGPGTFTSTLQAPFIYPATAADSGWYTVIKTVGASSDTSKTHVVIYAPDPAIASSNAPLCAGLVDTLKLAATPDSTGETFAWTGPAGFTSALQNPTIPGFLFFDTGTYRVITTTSHGCLDTAYTHVITVPAPAAPVISGVSSYCQGATFVPFTLSGVSGTVYWYVTDTSRTGSIIPSAVSTVIPGLYTVFASQLIGSCQSPFDSFTVRVVTTPPAPTVTGTFQYCQYIGPYTPVSATLVTGGIANWYTVATGGTRSATEPAVNIDVATTYDFWIDQTDSGCVSPRTPVAIVIHPKPNPPIITGQGPYCQYQYAAALAATPSETGDALTWYGAGISTSGSIFAPSPQTDTARIDSYFVDETSAFGCVSDSSIDTVRVITKPAPPLVSDTTYCEYAQSVPESYLVDSMHNSNLKWYVDASIIAPPFPGTNAPGITTWYVTQTIQTCQSDSVPIKVTVILTPEFTINAQSPWVCQQDSILLSYHGSPLYEASYQWLLPTGDSFATGSRSTDSMVLVRFDSSSANAYIYLRASDNNGLCSSVDTIKIKVVPEPTAYVTTKNDVCVGDTATLSIGGMSDNANSFNWTIDYTNPLITSPAISMIAAGSGSGGPFTVSWVDTGIHVIQLNTFSTEGCTANPSFDTVDVHQAPDATFKMELIPNTLCIQDSVFFVANASTVPNSYNDSYTWSPAHSFTNVNQSSAWGRVEETSTIISLTVTDPFGCSATASTELEPGSCCTVNFPNAFTPNGDGHNDYFRPLFTGYHNFHVFRIQNRWGQTVFETTSGDMKWDGAFNGVPQDMGVYFYYIKYDCGGKTIEESGDVTLIR